MEAVLPSDLTVLQTRLNRPYLPEHMLARPGLLELLDLKDPKALTTVVAPAGFGKTTLISSWLEEMRCPDQGIKPGCLPSSWLPAFILVVYGYK